MSAKELCALLITRQLENVNEEQEDLIVDYLDELGIDVDIDEKPQQICRKLLQLTMQEELGRTVPLTAYANKILGTEKSKRKEKDTKKVLEKRKEKKQKLKRKSRELPGCIPAENMLKGLFIFIVDPDLGIETDMEGDKYYKAVVAVSPNLFEKIFLATTDPIIELTTSKGDKGYARVSTPADIAADNMIYVTPLVATMLNLTDVTTEGFVKLCIKMPTIGKIDFTFYGSQEALDKNLSDLVRKLPLMINAFSSIQLGMEINVRKNGNTITVRVDELRDTDGEKIYAGIIPFGLTDIPFDIEPDVKN